jgi:hypothetical protein
MEVPVIAQGQGDINLMRLLVHDDRIVMLLLRTNLYVECSLHTRTHCHTLQKKKKMSFTYGIRAGSAHDLGFAAASIDLNGFLFYIYCC